MRVHVAGPRCGDGRGQAGCCPHLLPGACCPHSPLQLVTAATVATGTPGQQPLQGTPTFFTTGTSPLHTS